MTPMPTFALLTLALTALPGQAANDHGASTRDLTAQETAAFERFYQGAYPGLVAPPAVFHAKRAGGHRWDISATVDTPPQRSPAALCRMTRSHFAYDARAPRDQRWSAAPEPEQFVWRATGPACAVPTNPVLLTQALADGEITPLLQQQGALLARARLLMAGNTDCAWQRSLNFTLVAIDVPPAVAGKTLLRGLRFESDRASSATVWVRRSGTDLTAWNITCDRPTSTQKKTPR